MIYSPKDLTIISAGRAEAEDRFTRNLVSHHLSALAALVKSLGVQARFVDYGSIPRLVFEEHPWYQGYSGKRYTRYVEATHFHLAKAWNAGLATAQTQLVAFTTPETFIETHAIEKTLDLIAGRPYFVLNAFPWETPPYWTEKILANEHSPSDPVIEQLSVPQPGKLPLPYWMVVTRELSQGVDGFDERMDPNDSYGGIATDFHHRALALAQRRGGDEILTRRIPILRLHRYAPPAQSPNPFLARHNLARYIAEGTEPSLSWKTDTPTPGAENAALVAASG